MKHPRLFLAISSLALMSACATPQVAVNPRADFSTIKRVAVLPFSGAHGDLAADMLTQSLIARGADVVERQRLDAVLKEQTGSASTSYDPATAIQVGKILGVDALFVGTVGESTPQTSYIVSGTNDSIVTNVTKVSGGSVYSEGSVLGVPNSQILSTTANVSLIARMVDAQTGSIMWSASMSYEGFDVSSAMREICESFASSLSPIWPGLTK